MAKLLNEVDIMRKVDALLVGLSLSAQSRIVAYFTAVVGERIADAQKRDPDFAEVETA